MLLLQKIRTYSKFLELASQVYPWKVTFQQILNAAFWSENFEVDLENQNGSAVAI